MKHIAFNKVLLLAFCIICSVVAFAGCNDSDSYDPQEVAKYSGSGTYTQDSTTHSYNMTLTLYDTTYASFAGTIDGTDVEYVGHWADNAGTYNLRFRNGNELTGASGANPLVLTDPYRAGVSFSLAKQ